MWYRIYGSGPISKIGLYLGASSGNICVGVYRGTQGDAAPTARLATSGSVASPGTGYREISLGGTVVVNENTDWFAFSADNTTVTVADGMPATTGVENAIGAGFAYRALTSFPLPSTATGLVATIRCAFILVGRP
jgi:hypothetical protein